MTPGAYARVTAALDHLQRAQTELERACQDLSPVIGAAPEWRRVSALHDRVRTEWYKLNSHLESRAKWRVDSEPTTSRGDLTQKENDQ